MNESGWSPTGRAILVKPHTEKKKNPESKIIIPESVSDRTRLMEDRAIVVEIGPLAWSEEPMPRAAIGQEVILAAFAGYLLKGDDGEMYRFVNEREVFAVRNTEVNHG